MRKKLVLLLVCMLLSVALSGCWSYRGINEMALVMGMSIDRNPDTGTFMLSCEIADLTNGSKEGIKSKIVESEGRTVFEALRNAKRKLLNKLYFGNMSTVIFGEEIARTEGIRSIVEFFLGDAELRETIDVCIAIGSQAKDVLAIEGLDQSIVSLEISSIIAEDNAATSSTISTKMYQAYNTLDGPGSSLALPAFHIVKNDDKDIIEAYGVAIFQEDKLVGFLDPDETRLFLAATDRMHGGIMNLPADGSGAPDVVLEIEDSKAKTSFEIVDEKLVFHIKTETTAFLSQVPNEIDVLDQKQIEVLETRAGYMLANGIADFITKVQRDFGTDIFGLGKSVHNKNHAVWHQIQSKWKEMFPTVTVVVTCNVTIVNTAFIITKGALAQ